MRKFLVCLLLLAAFACTPYEVPSYVGKWVYAGSEPELGAAYADSWVTVDRQWNYTFYDAPSGQTFSGEAKDFSYEGMTITLVTVNETETRTYVAELQFLKDDRMVVKTSSVNGTPTVIYFTRVSRSV